MVLAWRRSEVGVKLPMAGDPTLEIFRVTEFERSESTVTVKLTTPDPPIAEGRAILT
jgi:hypothetical protein